MHKSTDTSADWDLYRYFLAVMECGSLSAAARRLRAVCAERGRSPMLRQGPLI